MQEYTLVTQQFPIHADVAKSEKILLVH